MDDERSTLWHVQAEVEPAEYELRPPATSDDGSCVGGLKLFRQRIPDAGRADLLTVPQACVEGTMPACFVVLENHEETRRVREPLSRNAAKSNALGGRGRVRQTNQTLGSQERVCQGVRMASSRSTLQYKLVHPPLSVVRTALSLYREAKANRCVAEREHQIFALGIIQSRLCWPE
jgi:hypothetical protein